MRLEVRHKKQFGHTITMALPIVAILLAVLLALPLACGKKDAGVVKIGAILPLTGENATYGTSLKRGMDLAIDMVNSAGGIDGKNIVVVYEDGQGDPSESVSAFNKLTTVEKVPLVIGPMFSAPALAVAPIAERNHKVLLSPTASAVELTHAGDYIFRIYPSDSYDGSFLADFAWKDMESKSVFVIYLQVASVSAVSKVFKETYQSLGGRILGMESYNEGNTDFRNQLLKAKNSNPDMIFIPGYLREMATLLRQAKELGIKKQFVSIATFFDTKVLDLAGETAEGVVFSTPYFDPSSPETHVTEFTKAFSQKYERAEPDILAGYGYDVVNITTQALSAANSLKPEDIKSAVYTIRDFPGVTGKTTFDSNGDVIKELKMMQVKSGAFVPYE